MSFTLSASLSPFTPIFTSFPIRHNLLVTKSSLHSSASTSSPPPTLRRLSPDFTPAQLLRTLRLQSDETSALRMLDWASKQPQFVPTCSVYEEVLRKLGKVGSFESMLRILEEMRLAGSEIRTGTFSILVESYANFEFYDEIPGVVELMEVGFGLKPDRDFYNLVFSALFDGNEVRLAGIAYSGMVGRGIEPDVSTFRIVIKGLCRARQIRAAIAVMEEMLSHGFSFSPDKAMISMLMQGCVEEGYLDGFLRIREKLWECGRIREALYVLKSEGACKTRYARRDDEVINKRVEEIFDPGIFTCKPLVSREGDVFDQIVLRNRPLAYVANGISYSNLCERKQIGEATKFGDILRNEVSMRDACELNSLMHELCVTGNHGVAMELFGEAKSRGCRIDVCTYNILIDSFCSMQRFEDAMSLLKEMDSRGCARTVVTYNIMIKGFCKNRFVEEAMVIFQQMELRGVSRNLLTYNTLIDGLCKSMRIEDAVNLMDQMAKEGLKPDKFTYNSLLVHFSRTGNVKKAADILRAMTSNGCEPDIVTFNTLIGGMCKSSRVDLDVAIRIIRTLDVKGKVITPHAYNPVIHELCKRNRRKEAMEFFREMMEKGDPPNAITYNIVFGGLCSGGGPIGDAIDFAVEMMGKGFVPKSSYFLTLAEGLCALSMEKTLTKLITMLMEVANLSDSEVSKIKGFLNTRKFRDGLLTLGAILDKHQNPKSAN